MERSRLIQKRCRLAMTDGRTEGLSLEGKFCQQLPERHWRRPINCLRMHLPPNWNYQLTQKILCARQTRLYSTLRKSWRCTVIFMSNDILSRYHRYPFFQAYAHDLCKYSVYSQDSHPSKHPMSYSIMVLQVSRRSVM